ncbi:cation:proton antiporter [Marinilongibacter aquaticus]|uniref:cation:proton antiporter n=1 Tax=Marinilongibacter aquaticus TaxID=2975157 RepID=UPI0021BD5064|nr:cation:proton antiporter [Marinilongibacter aquaticus]UBM58752.1 cation:proton antiporter [Marinilongibacter aquaticus]
MNHLPQLIQDLGLILILAGTTTLLFKQMKQPVVLGYILAGLLVGPHFRLFPTVTDIQNVQVWAEIGVIVLLFGLGLEFSFKKLMKVGGSASVTALFEISAMVGIGYLIGYALNWPLMDRIFLGGILSIASTTIILRSFTELGLKGKRFTELVFGVLIIEDLVAVVLLVLLSTIAVSSQFAGTEMLVSILKLVFFLTLWFIAGIFFLPSLLHRAKHLLNEETLLIVSLGLCLSMVVLSSASGFSPALGAFVMGSILAETTKAERIERAIKPVSDLFGAIFFVSVGMLINPAVLIDYWGPIILVTVALLVAKTLHVTIGALIAGNPLDVSLSAGMSMAQIGEFSFIIATLGVSLGVTSSFLYPIAVAVSALTTFSTPYMIRFAGPLYHRIESLLPSRWKKSLERYSSGASNIRSANDWRILLRAYLFHIVLFSFIIVGIVLGFQNFALPWLKSYMPNTNAAISIGGTACFLVLSPFLWALVFQKIKPGNTANLWANKWYRGPLVALNIFRIALGISFVFFTLVSLFPLLVSVAGIAAVVLLSVLFSGKISRLYQKIERRFFVNLNAREIQNARFNRQELAPWDAHIVQHTLPFGSPVAGQRLEDMAIREKYGVNIVMIKRGEEQTIPIPGRDERLFPGDNLFVLGTDRQIDLFKKHVHPAIEAFAGKDLDKEIGLTSINVPSGSALIGQTISSSGIRERTNGLVVGIERDAMRILNPESRKEFLPGDRIWIVGDLERIKQLQV